VADETRWSRLPVVGTLLRVLERYKLDAADQFAASIALFGFLALILLFLLGIATTGFVLRDPADQVRLAEALARSVPGLGATLGGDEGVAGFVARVVDARGALTGVGLVGLVLTALRPVNAAMIATTTVFRSPLPQGGRARLRQVGAVITLGVVAIAAVATSALVGVAAIPGPVQALVGVGVTFALDVLLFWSAYTVLSPGSVVRGRGLLPGALLAGAGWTLLKVAGSAYVSGQLETANALYGALGGVVALLLLLYLAGRLYLYGAELAAVRHERAHGPIEVGAGAMSLVHVDAVSPARSTTGAGGEVAARTDPRRVAGWARALVGVAAGDKVMRQLAAG
jgi:YihY family inner membrane protein